MQAIYLDVRRKDEQIFRLRSTVGDASDLAPRRILKGSLFPAAKAAVSDSSTGITSFIGSVYALDFI